jgi:hypothetical protein
MSVDVKVGVVKLDDILACLFVTTVLNKPVWRFREPGQASKSYGGKAPEKILAPSLDDIVIQELTIGPRKGYGMTSGRCIDPRLFLS